MTRQRLKIDPARKVAFDLLRAVEERDAYANLLLPTLLKDASLNALDASFATELAYGTLRMRGQHDWVLSQVVDRPLEQIDAPLLDVLRLGVHQLHYMRVPTHAAVGESVELAKAVVGVSRSSLVNAVLRTVAAKSHEKWLLGIPTDRRLEIEYSHPGWIIDACKAALGPTGNVEEFLAADNRPARVALAARTPQIEAELLQSGGEPGRIPGAVIWRGPLQHPALGTPILGVQDEGSQWVTRELANVDVANDRRWLDLCAGPGGKAALLSAIASQRDEQINLTANEISEHRAQLVRAVVGPNTSVVVGDGRELQGRFDRILLDAPCSGLGALRRRPEARWRRTPSDVGRLRPLQQELLAHALTLLAPGGVLAYVTCSPHPAETVQIVAPHVSSGYELIPAGTFAGLESASPLLAGTSQLWPHVHGTDAMFLALIRGR